MHAPHLFTSFLILAFAMAILAFFSFSFLSPEKFISDILETGRKQPQRIVYFLLKGIW